ncbi:MAG: protoporphyrinogen oxidase [Candidatus Tectomicrobia bacterium]|nr:protoporphyrinogen oxidase [Candidatus Tectomicrobia bacterium]
MLQDAPRQLAVIGGGISGLAAAYRLTRLGRERGGKVEVILLEAQQRLGGVIHSHHEEGLLLEEGPDAFITTKPWALKLCQELGLQDDLIRTQSTPHGSFILRDNTLHPMPEGFLLFAPTSLWPFLRTPLFTWRGKLRMAMDLVLPRRRRDGGAPQDESLEAFVIRRLGREALERMAQPLVAGIYTGDARQLSLQATMPQMLEMEEQERSIIRAMWKNRRAMRKRGLDTRQDAGARYGLFLTLRRGLGTLIERLAGQLPEGSVRTGCRVVALEHCGEAPQWKVRIEGGASLRADGICVALPAPPAAALLGGLLPDLAKQLAGVPYASSAIVNLAFRRRSIAHPLDGMGFVVPRSEDKSLIACSFSSVKFEGRSPRDVALLRAFVGGAVQPERYALSDADMVQALLGDLRPVLGIKEEPLLARVSRHPGAMAQYHLGHLDKVRAIEALRRRVPGFALAGNAYRGIGIPDCIHSADQAAQVLIEQVPAS